MGRPISKKVLYLRWAANGPTGVRSNRQIKPWIRRCTGTRFRRGRRRVLVAIPSGIERRVIVYPICGCFLTICELASLHLTDNDDPRINEPLDSKSTYISGRIQCISCSITIACLHASNIVNILDSKSNSSKRFSRCDCGIKARWYSDSRCLYAYYSGWQRSSIRVSHRWDQRLRKGTSEVGVEPLCLKYGTCEQDKMGSRY